MAHRKKTRSEPIEGQYGIFYPGFPNFCPEEGSFLEVFGSAVPYDRTKSYFLPSADGSVLEVDISHIIESSTTQSADPFDLYTRIMTYIAKIDNSSGGTREKCSETKLLLESIADAAHKAVTGGYVDRVYALGARC